MYNESPFSWFSIAPSTAFYLTIIITLIFICFSALRPSNMFSQSVVYCTSQDAVQVDLAPLHIPFTLNILGDGTSSSDASAVVRCELKSEQVCRIRFLWKVPFAVLGRLLSIVTAADAVQFHCDLHSLDPGEHIIEARYRGNEPLEEPTSQKNHYPLVAVVETTSAPQGINEVVALVVVIHVRDSRIAMSTAALHRYVRQANGRVVLLQMAGGGIGFPAGSLIGPLSRGLPGSDGSRHKSQGVAPLYSSGVDGSAGPLGACSVCHGAPAEVVLLPCRHGCVCRPCFRRMDTCPLCRGFIAQYFTVPTTESGTPERPEEAPSEEMASAGRAEQSR